MDFEDFHDLHYSHVDFYVYFIILIIFKWFLENVMIFVFFSHRFNKEQC